MSAAVRKWIIRTPDDALAVWLYLKEHAKTYLELGTPLQVVMSKYRATRSNEQNAFMWAAVLTPTAEQATDEHGRHYSEEVWNLYLKKRFLPETCAKGVDKWLQMPDGERELVMSTSDLNVEEMTAYLEEIQAHLVSEFGVRFIDLNH
jgi:hypothetical protein